AVSALSKGGDDDRAYAQLRSLAMSWQISVEDAARRIVAMTDEAKTEEEGGDDQSHRA
ncbi:MAG: transcriptional antiterminator, partial [Mesorhizobium sp.]